MQELFRQLPGVDTLCADPQLADVHPAVRKAAVRQVLDEVRNQIRAGAAELPDVLSLVIERAHGLKHGRMRRVINATGVVLHTNLGRARWSDGARQAALKAMGPCNLEIELADNVRGGRLDGLKWAMRALVGAEDTIVVNNCAAAVLLALTALARDRDVLVSRGELVEIGGSFRVPEVIASGGARLVEVGTTNRTRTADFVNNTTDDTTVWLRVHTSNFRIDGFTEQPDPATMREAAREAGVHLLEDLGSGCLTPVQGERTVQEAVDQMDLVMFSGDKLLGGPQAGLIVGKRELVQRLRKHPLYRALRVDKVTLAALEATLTDHLTGRAIPAMDMLHADPDQARQRAEQLAETLGATVVPAAGRAGGGTLPEVDFPGFAVRLDGWTSGDARALRLASTSVLARTGPDGVDLDLRCVTDDEVPELIASVVEVRSKRY